MAHLEQLEADLHDSFGQYDDLLQVAGEHARDAERLRQDVAAMIFPRAFNPPSEALLADISRKFSRLVKDIEAQIVSDGPSDSGSLAALLQSGYQRDPALLEFLLARHAEQQLEMRLASKSDTPLSETLPARLLVSADQNIAAAAQALLASSSLNRRVAPIEWCVLPPELLHGICWRIVAVQPADDAATVRQKTQQLLSGYDETRTPANAAQKLLHLLGPAHQDDLQQVAKSGLTLFVADLAGKTLLRPDQIFRMIDLPSISPFAVLQRAADIDAASAMENIRAFFGFDMLTPQDIILFENGFTSLSPEDAKAAVLGWRSESASIGGDTA